MPLHKQIGDPAVESRNPKGKVIHRPSLEGEAETVQGHATAEVSRAECQSVVVVPGGSMDWRGRDQTGIVVRHG